MFKNLNLIFQILFILLVVSPYKVSAEELSLGVYPPLIHIKAVTPDDIKTPLTIQNPSNNPVSLSISFKPFTSSKAGNGEVSFINDGWFNQLVENKKITILDGETPISTIELGAKQTKDLFLRINLSQEEKTSDYYFSVIFASNNDSIIPTSIYNKEEKIAQTYISLGVAANVLLSVNPQGNPKVSIQQYSTPSLIDQGPVSFKVQLANTSGYVIPVEGNILITNMFGQTIGRIDLPSSYILNNTSRVFSNTIWEEKFLLGYYKATLNLKLDNSETIITRDISFIAIPLQSAIIIISVLCLFLLIQSRIKANQK